MALLTLKARINHALYFTVPFFAMFVFLADTTAQVTSSEIAFRICLIFGSFFGVVLLLHFLLREVTGWSLLMRTFPGRAMDQDETICLLNDVKLDGWRLSRATLRFTRAGLHLSVRSAFHKPVFVPYSYLRYVDARRITSDAFVRAIGMQDCVFYDLVVDSPVKFEIPLGSRIYASRASAWRSSGS